MLFINILKNDDKICDLVIPLLEQLVTAAKSSVPGSVLSTLFKISLSFTKIEQGNHNYLTEACKSAQGHILISDKGGIQPQIDWTPEPIFF